MAEFPPSWVEFPLPSENLHGDPLCLKDVAPTESPHAIFLSVEGEWS
jgi:hypothetical protein